MGRDARQRRPRIRSDPIPPLGVCQDWILCVLRGENSLPGDVSLYLKRSLNALPGRIYSPRDLVQCYNSSSLALEACRSIFVKLQGGVWGRVDLEIVCHRRICRRNVDEGLHAVFGVEG